MDEKAKITILGAGSWGATLSWLLAANGRSVTLWSSSAEKASRLARERKVDSPLTISLPDSLAVTADLDEACAGADIVIIATTSQAMRDVAARLQDVACTAARPIFLSVAKGLELGTLKRMSEVLLEFLPGQAVAALSGPNLAGEILAGLPTASVVAAVDRPTAAALQSVLTVPGFRIYINDDLAGVELGGTLKNIIAIAAGASDGLMLGANAKAALITRGLAEMTRLATAMGADRRTLFGLAGMGDLIATCTSPLSRNYRLGLTMAQGKNRQEALASLNACAEGVTTVAAVCELSQRLGIELPIADQVNAVVSGKTTPKQAIMSLMARPLSSE